LNDYIARIAINNGMNLEEFIDEVSSQTSFKSFRRNLKNDLIIKRVQRGLVGPKVFISDQEIKNFIISKEGQNLIIVEYKINQILVDSEEISKKIYQGLEDGENFLNLKTKYDLSGDEELPKWQKISELPSLFSIAKDMEIGAYSKPLKTGAGFYLIKLEEKRGDTVKIEKQDLVRHILIQTSEIRSEKQARELINEIKNRIDEGEDFKVLARLYSDDPSSKLDGGNLGWSSSDKYDSEFKKVVDNSELNKVSNVFKSSFGHHILEVLDRRKKDISKELQKNKAYRIIFDRKYEELLQKTLQELRAESYIDIKTEI
jgi:peptidyl-prolyl cis-trans isomerase SurA